MPSKDGKIAFIKKEQETKNALMVLFNVMFTLDNGEQFTSLLKFTKLATKVLLKFYYHKHIYVVSIYKNFITQHFN